jgi:hypothetical protein
MGYVVIGCGQGAPPITTEVESQVMALAEPAAGELMRTLVSNLTAAMEEGGPEHAIGFCSTEAIPLTLQVQTGLPDGMEIKRTSFRFRNPANAPDTAEEEALLFFEEAFRGGGELPSSLVQQVSSDEYRYYRPLYLGEVCLQCHGHREALTPAVRSLIEELYPEDLAMGYGPGEFRGLVRVSVPASAIGPSPRP